MVYTIDIVVNFLNIYIYGVNDSSSLHQYTKQSIFVIALVFLKLHSDFHYIRCYIPSGLF